MSERKELGRIKSATFGYGGYQDAMIGLSITLGGLAWGCGDFRGAWGIDRSDNARWSEDDRLRDLGRACMWLRDILKAAGKTSVADLAGTPIEATFDGMALKSWRVLTEVLA